MVPPGVVANLSSFPANPEGGDAVFVESEDQIYFFDSDSSTWKDSGIIGSAIWGNVQGTLSDQTDLQTALDGKAGLSTENTFEEDQFFSGHIRDVDSGLTISDDTTVAIPRLFLIGLLLINSRNNSYPNAGAILDYRHTSNRFVRIIAQAGNDWERGNVVGAPSDTEGTDGKITAFASDDGNIYINNRLGTTISIHINRFGR